MIEEEEPQVEKKESKSLVPIQLRNYPNQVFWIPRDYMDGEGYGIPKDEFEGVKQDRIPYYERPLEKPIEQEPGNVKVWYPFDMNSHKPTMPDGDRKKIQSEGYENEEKSRQFPFPIVWMPSLDKQGEAPKTYGQVDSPKYSMVSHSPNRFVPMEANDESSDKLPSGTEDWSGSLDSKATKKPAGVKDIPVRHPEQLKEDVKEKEKKGGDVVVVSEDDAAAETSQQGSDVRREYNVTPRSSEKTERQSTSPKSKLPPVCLRVDPLPRKKTNNATSHSPNPPSHKGDPNDELQTTVSSGMKVSTEHKSDFPAKGEAGAEKVKKTIEVMEGTPSANENKNCASKPQVPIDLPAQSKDQDKGKVEDKKDASTNKGMKEDETKKESELYEGDRGKPKADVKRLSDEQAAVLIQSTYRGFALRKWEPVKKLKQMAKVREQVEEVRKHVEALQSSFDCQKDDKQRVAIGEAIMSLLLKLDTIQGLHPSLRDVRKSLAGELITLQEKLDSLMMNKAKEPCHGLSVGETSKTDIADTNENQCPENGGVQKARGPEVDEHESRHHDTTVTEKVSDALVVATGSLDEGISEASLADKKAHEFDNGTIQDTTADYSKFVDAQTQDTVEVKDLAQIKNQGNEAPGMGREFDLSASNENISSECQSESLRHTCGQINIDFGEEGATVLPGNLMNMMEEVPIGVLDESTAQDQKNNVNQMNMMEELPVGVLDEKTEYYRENVRSTDEGSSLATVVNAEPINISVEFIQGSSEDGSLAFGSEDREQLGKGGNNEGAATISLKEGIPFGESPEKANNDKISVDLRQELEVHGHDNEMATVNQELEPETDLSNCQEMDSRSEYRTDAHDQEMAGPVLSQMEKVKPNELNNGIPMQEEHARSENVEGCLILDKEPVSMTTENANEEVCLQSLAPELVAPEEKISDLHNVNENEVALHEPSLIREEYAHIAELDEEKNMKEEPMSEKEASILYPKPDSATCEEKISGSNNVSETFEKEEASAGELNPSPSRQIKDKENPTPNSPTSGEVTCGESKTGLGSNEKLTEENEKLREMMEKLLESEKAHLNVISSLTGRVKDLEKKLAKRKHLKTKRIKRVHSDSANGNKLNGVNGFRKGSTIDVTM